MFRLILTLLLLSNLFLYFQNCSPLQSLQGPLSSLSSDNSAQDDAMMDDINKDLFTIALKYFPNSSEETPEKRLFRLTQTQIDNTTKSLLEGLNFSSVSNFMAKDPLVTNYEYSDIINFNKTNLPAYTEWLDSLAKTLENNSNAIINCETDNNSEACLSNKAQNFINLSFRGTAPQDVVDKYLNFFLNATTETTLAQAKIELLHAIFNSPYFLFRVELNTDGSNFLNSYELLQHMTYTLSDYPYYSLLSQNFRPEDIKNDQKQIDQTVKEILSTEQAQEKLIRFFKSWLEIKEADELTGFEATLPEFNAQMAEEIVSETDRFLKYHITQAAPKLKDITQSTKSFVNQTLNRIYQNNVVSETQQVGLNEKQRLGIFTQSSFISSHSGPEDTRLVKRGVFFTRKMMCLEIGAVPGDIETELPPDNGQMTERQRIEAGTNNSKCLGCHRFINPFGFTQENYNPLGQWRTTDHHGLPIDPSISIDFLDSGTFTSDDPIRSLKYFTDSMRFKQCFVRQLFRYYMGRRETSSDNALLRKMFFYFAYEDKQDLLALIQMMATSSRFSQRIQKENK